MSSTQGGMLSRQDQIITKTYSVLRARLARAGVTLNSTVLRVSGLLKCLKARWKLSDSYFTLRTSEPPECHAPNPPRPVAAASYRCAHVPDLEPRSGGRGLLRWIARRACRAARYGRRRSLLLPAIARRTHWPGAFGVLEEALESAGTDFRAIVIVNEAPVRADQAYARHRRAEVKFWSTDLSREWWRRRLVGAALPLLAFRS